MRVYLELIVTVVILTTIFLGLGVLINQGTQIKSHDICIESKEVMIKNSGNGISRNKLVFTTDGKVFDVEDSLLALEFESLETYAGLKVGKCYNVKTNWFRFGLLSWKENILEFNEKVLDKQK